MVCSQNIRTEPAGARPQMLAGVDRRVHFTSNYLVFLSDWKTPKVIQNPSCVQELYSAIHRNDAKNNFKIAVLLCAEQRRQLADRYRFKKTCGDLYEISSQAREQRQGHADANSIASTTVTKFLSNWCNKIIGEGLLLGPSIHHLTTTFKHNVKEKVAQAMQQDEDDVPDTLENTTVKQMVHVGVIACWHVHLDDLW